MSNYVLIYLYVGTTDTPSLSDVRLQTLQDKNYDLGVLMPLDKPIN